MNTKRWAIATFLLLVTSILVGRQYFARITVDADPSMGDEPPRSRDLGPGQPHDVDPNPLTSDGTQRKATRARLKVTDECGLPMSGVQVCVDLANISQTVTTDSAGICVPETTVPAGGTITVTNRNWTLPRAAVVREEGIGLLTATVTGMAIEGRVAFPNGTPCAHATVYAWPDGQSPDIAGLKNGTAELVASTDETGVFRICSCDPSRTYQVVAGTQGWVTEVGLAGIATGSYVDLPLAHVFGAAIHILTAEGKPASISDDLVGGPNIGIATSGLARPLNYELPQVCLAGLPPHLMPNRTRDQLILMIGGETEKSLGPFHSAAQYPGYKRTEFDWTASGLENGIEELDVSLESGAEGWGSIAVDFSPPPELTLGSSSGALAEFELVVAPIDGSGLSVYRLPQDIQHGVVLGPIPTGDYELRLRTSHKLLIIEPFPANVTLLDGQTLHTTATLPPLSGLRISIKMRDATYMGPVRLDVFVAEQPSAGDSAGNRLKAPFERVVCASFSHPPYCLYSLPATEYSVAAWIPGMESSARQPVTCRTGEVSEMGFKFP